jgi:hypothetical protein
MRCEVFTLRSPLRRGLGWVFKDKIIIKTIVSHALRGRNDSAKYSNDYEILS